MLNEYLSVLTKLPGPEKALAAKDILAATKSIRVVPNEGPQTLAALSDADVLLFGGSVGGGKTVLEILLAVNDHFRSLIVRKNFTDLGGIIDTAKKLLNDPDRFIGGSRPEYRKPDGGVIHFAGLSGDGGIGGHQGVDHDLICVDEAAQVPENQIRLLMGWLRTDKPGQRCRVVLASNPPLDSAGDWLLDYFAPWLNSEHPNPAKPGELRWFLPDEDGKDKEVNKGDWVLQDGVKVCAQSRTFIPSKFTDNPYYDAESYAKTLSGLPKEYRERLTTGNFMLARTADPWQVIPTDWIRAAQARWTPLPPQGIPLCAIGVDVAQGGDDNSVLARRYDAYFAELISTPGKQTPRGSDVAGLVFSHLRDNATVIIDMGGGYGGGPLELLSDNGVETVAYKGAESASTRTKDGKMGFVNVRSAAYWAFREALDPDQPGGSPVALPIDTELVADLTAPRYETTPRGYKITPKEDVVKELGRSTDKGDAVVMAWWKGTRRANMQGGKFKRKREISVNLGARQAARRH